LNQRFKFHASCTKGYKRYSASYVSDGMQHVRTAYLFYVFYYAFHWYVHSAFFLASERPTAFDHRAIIESLSKTTKDEDENVLDKFSTFAHYFAHTAVGASGCFSTSSLHSLRWDRIILQSSFWWQRRSLKGNISFNLYFFVS
jgi:hypothetical protein